ncbi:MAG: hypothetical protein GX096_15600 [Clostridiales bacterium]|nr:hypothetical protein [Clostridiales bacterium]
MTVNKPKSHKFRLKAFHVWILVLAVFLILGICVFAFGLSSPSILTVRFTLV